MREIFMMGGPNGAGKTTTAFGILPEAGVVEFVNADLIASGLSPFRPESQARQAGRLMLERLAYLRSSGESFCFETAMASRSFLPFLEECKNVGYLLNIVFVWLESPALARNRVAFRVNSGGHFVPDDIVERRYGRGIHNFLNLYRPLAHSWVVMNNSGSASLMVARQQDGQELEVFREDDWESILKWEGKPEIP
jgi:predicted ABC-type ATPase